MFLSMLNKIASNKLVCYWWLVWMRPLQTLYCSVLAILLYGFFLWLASYMFVLLSFISGDVIFISEHWKCKIYCWMKMTLILFGAVDIEKPSQFVLYAWLFNYGFPLFYAVLLRLLYYSSIEIKTIKRQSVLHPFWKSFSFMSLYSYVPWIFMVISAAVCGCFVLFSSIRLYS